MQATLVYTCAAGYQKLSTARDRVEDVELHVEGTADALGFDVVSDVTAISGAAIQRTIVLQTNAVGDVLWTTAAQVSAILSRLFRGGLEAQTPTHVLAADPVVT